MDEAAVGRALKPFSGRLRPVRNEEDFETMPVDSGDAVQVEDDDDDVVEVMDPIR